MSRYTQTAVRDELVLHRLGLIERGSMPLPPATIPRLADLYGVDEAALSAAAERTRAQWHARITTRK